MDKPTVTHSIKISIWSDGEVSADYLEHTDGKALRQEREDFLSSLPATVVDQLRELFKS
jgi:hypothetical protein